MEWCKVKHTRTHTHTSHSIITTKLHPRRVEKSQLSIGPQGFAHRNHVRVLVRIWRTENRLQEPRPRGRAGLGEPGFRNHTENQRSIIG